MKKIALFGMTAALTCFSFAATAELKVEDATKYRQGVFQAFKWNLGPMGAMVKGETEFNEEKFNMHAERLAQLSSMPWEGFIAGSFSKNTAALPKIENDREGYQKQIDNFQKAASNLAAAAKTNEMKNIGPAFAQAGRSCKSCHDKYKD